MATEKKISRKQQIAKAAMKIIANEGVQSLVMIKIAKLIGLTDAALYKHFNTKNDMLLFMVEEIENSLIINIEKKIDLQADACDKLKSILFVHLSFIEKNIGIPRVLFSEAIQFQDKRLRDKIAGIITQYMDYIKDIIQQAVDKGCVRKDLDVEAAAIMYMGIIQATFILWSTSDFSFPLTGKVDQLWATFSKCLY
ncbi:MAG: TetR/AcrR family transcriptional regulator [Calditrichaceae bacterium]